jgi:hypothetical protein
MGGHIPVQPPVPAADDGRIYRVQDNPLPSPPKPSHRTRNLVVVVVVAVVVVAALVCLCTIPVTASFSFTMNPAATWSPPPGSQVHGTFTTTDGGTVLFKIWSVNGDTVYSAESNNGSFSFTAANPPYTFDAMSFVSPHPVTVSGQYSSPILVL